jgi:hypothetical protein
MSTPTDSTLLLEQLGQQPNDLVLLERAVRALQSEGHEADAIALLTKNGRNLTAHEPPPMPCLCGRCLDPARTTAEGFGISFVRDFAVVEGRVLFYWVPKELAGRPGLRRSVATALGDNLKKKQKRRR